MNARLETFDFSVLEAARDLGASPFRTFLDITFPLIRPSIVGAALLAAALSLDEFVVTWFNIGNEQTVPVLVWGLMRRGVDPRSTPLASLLLLLLVCLVVLSNFMAGETTDMNKPASSARRSLIIRHAYVITMDDANRIFEHGAIAIDRGRIVAVGDDAVLSPALCRPRAPSTRKARPSIRASSNAICMPRSSCSAARFPTSLAESDAFDTFESVFFNTVNDEEEYLAVAARLAWR